MGKVLRRLQDPIRASLTEEKWIVIDGNELPQVGGPLVLTILTVPKQHCVG